MSYQDGMSALNLEKTSRVPRTEYSAESHWALVNKVTGTNVTSASLKEIQQKASGLFTKEWNYDFIWNVWLHSHVFGDVITKMGHAKFASDAVDYSNEVSNYFADCDEVLKFDAMSSLPSVDIADVIKKLDANYDSQVALYPNAVNMTGSYVSCVSGLIELFGWELLLEACGSDAAEFGKVTNRYSQYIKQYFEAMAQCKSPTIMVHDDICWTSGGIFCPQWYREFVFPNLKKCIDPLLEAGKKVIFTSDGNYSDYIDDVAALGVHGFVLEPCTDMKYIAEKYGKTHVFIGNADTRVLLSGSKEDIYNEVKRCMDIGKQCNGFFMAVGNHIPSNTPLENAIYYNECYEKLGKR